MTIKPTAAAKRKVFFSTNLRNATGENSGAHLEKQQRFSTQAVKEKRKKEKRKEKKGLLNPHTHVPAVSYGLSEET